MLSLGPPVDVPKNSPYIFWMESSGIGEIGLISRGSNIWFILPVMGDNDMINIVRICHFYVLFCTINIYAIEICDDTNFLKRRLLFVWEIKLSVDDIKNLVCNVRACTTYSKIFKTYENKYNVTIKYQTIDASVMGCSVKTKFWRK